MSRTLPNAASAIQFLLIAALPAAATAADFNITGSSSSAQSLAAGQTGKVSAGGALNVSGGTAAVTVTGNNATLNNLGTIKQTGTGRVIRDNTGVQTLVINNGSLSNSSALMQTADADVIQMNVKNASVTLNNYGVMISTNKSADGAQVVDFKEISNGSNVVNNFAGAQMIAYEADAVRTGVNGVVNNYGLIKAVTAAGGSSDGIDVQSGTGAKIANFGGGVVEGGRHGITGGQDKASAVFTIDIGNESGGIIRGMNGAGINLDGVNAGQTARIANAGLISGNGISGDGDGIDVDGIAHITNSGVIRSINAFSAAGAGLAYSEGISMGGGSVTNSGTIEGLVSTGNGNAVGRGITLAGNDLSNGTREGLYSSVTITNLSGGTIQGQSDSAIVTVGAASGHTVTIINNSGGSIIGGGLLNAAIKTGPDNTIITSGGTINGASSGKAIDMGSGKNSLTITGGTISGGIHGGSGQQNTLSVEAGAGNSFTYGGAISGFNKVEVKSGDVTFSGISSYSGATQLSGGKLTLVGAQRLSADSALILNGGTLRLNAAGADGQRFASLSLSADSSVLLGGSSLTFGALGTLVDGTTLTFTEAAAGVYAFRLLGDYSTDGSFLALLNVTHINGQGATYAFDGTYTKVLAAVPEPSTYAMLFTGLALLGVVARRRTKV
nr:FxDxF family PEP-CTERM protein [uncultured Duganella sp.]